MLPLVLALCTIPATAGNPLYVSGPNPPDPGGEPYRWADNTLRYYTDMGGLGSQTNSEANALVEAAFQVWADVDTADIQFERLGALSEDISAGTILNFINDVYGCERSDNSVIYDLDGSALAELGYDNNSVLGFAGAAEACFDIAENQYTNGWAVLNGRFIDGQPNTPSHHSLTLDEFKAAFVHEFGHLIGLGHSQINVNCLTDMPCPEEDMDGVPVMFPFLLEISPEAILKTDDKSSVSMLYPSPTLGTATGRIRGHVLFADGKTPAQGYNVVARNLSSPRSTAVSSVSGFLYTPAAGNELVPNLVDTYVYFGSRDPALIGYYEIPGLPPGEYTIEVEPIHNSGDTAFVGGSGVGPIGEYLGFQFKMPGRCSPQYLHTPSSADDDCSDFSILNVNAGQDLNINTDVIFLGTPPRYDAWEDGE